MRYPLVVKTKGETALKPLALVQRYQIEHDIQLGLNNKVIAQGIGFSCRTVEREVKRCGGRAHYTAARALAHRQQCGRNSAANHPTLPKSFWVPVEAEIRRKLSPEQVVQQLKLTAAASTIYRYLYRFDKKRLLKQLRHYSAIKRRRGEKGQDALGSSRQAHSRATYRGADPRYRWPPGMRQHCRQAS